MPLEDYDSGDPAFSRLADLLRGEWAACPFQQPLLDRVGDEEIAVVVYGSLLDGSLEWLERNVPALDGATPLDCLRTAAGARRLKECLLRFPR